MKYTRRTYVDVSGILNKFVNKIDSEHFDELVFEFSEFFLEDNKNFDEDRFADACYKENN